MALINPLTLDPGTQADWASAVGSILAASFAAVAITRDIKTRRDQREEAAQRADLERRLQARRVSITEPRSAPLTPTPPGFGGGSFSETHLLVLNGSEEVITNLVLLIAATPATPRLKTIVRRYEHGRVLPEEHAWSNSGFRFHWPEDTETQQPGPSQDEDSGELLGSSTGTKVEFVANLAFDDAAGVRWVRDRHHALLPNGRHDLFEQYPDGIRVKVGHPFDRIGGRRVPWVVDP